ERDPALLTNDRNDRYVIALGVEEPVHQVQCTGSRSCHTHADFTGELGVRGGHECGFFFVGRTNIPKIFPVLLGPTHGPVEAADTIARVAVPLVQAPIDESIDHEITNGCCYSDHAPEGFDG